MSPQNVYDEDSPAFLGGCGPTGRAAALVKTRKLKNAGAVRRVCGYGGSEMNILTTLLNKKTCTFAAGVAAGLALPLAVKSKAARRAAVNLVARGLRLRDNAQTALASIQEEAQDIYAEAKRRRAPSEED
jgi:hypothetical protein